MANYDFSTLNDKDLEELALDLLNAQLKLDLQSFKVGIDGGVDLRHSTPKNDNSIVVQVKHYLNSGYSKLKSDLKNKELKKVKKLNPDRYIIVTSVELSKFQKDELKDIFSPFIKTSNDIIGSQDLNKYLRKFKSIEKSHFKLWFSSTEIISNIINNAIEGRTRSYLERIKSKIPLYVLTKNLDDANKILEKEKILLITGLPGIGKTTLAEVLLYEKAKSDYKIYWINKIRDAEDVISQDETEKQIFYFDDFLGEVYYEILTGSQNESEIAGFVDRIKHTPNKYIILSTRTVILEQAKAKSEKIKRSRIETGKYEIKLNNYSNLEKAQILYNHIYFRNLKDELVDAIIHNQFYKIIIKHKSYTPRIIEFITDENRVNNFNKEEYLTFIKHNLDHPEEIWNYSFSKQIDYFDRCFLITLFTFQRGANENILNQAFKSRLEYEKTINNKEVDSEQFNNSIKSLLNGFIMSSIIDLDKNVKICSLINPSLSDFILGYLNQNYEAKKALIKSIKFIEQLDFFNPDKSQIKLEKELQEVIRDKILKKTLESSDQYKEYKYDGLCIEVLTKYCKKVDFDGVLLEILDRINLNNIWWIRNNLEYVFENIKNCPKSEKYISDNFNLIINSYIDKIEDVELAIKLPVFFKRFNCDFDTYADSEVGQVKMIDLISNIVVKSEKDLVSSHKDSILDIEDIEDMIYNDLNDRKQRLLNELLPNTIFDIPRHFEKDDWEKQIKINSDNEQESIKREKNSEKYYEQLEYNTKIENVKIDDLFYKS